MIQCHIVSANGHVISLCSRWDQWENSRWCSECESHTMHFVFTFVQQCYIVLGITWITRFNCNIAKFPADAPRGHSTYWNGVFKHQYLWISFLHRTMQCWLEFSNWNKQHGYNEIFAVSKSALISSIRNKTDVQNYVLEGRISLVNTPCQ